MDDKKNLFDRLKDSMDSFSDRIEDAVDKLEDVAEDKYDQLKNSESFGPAIRKGEGWLDELETQADGLKKRFLGDDEDEKFDWNDDDFEEEDDIANEFEDDFDEDDFDLDEFEDGEEEDDGKAGH